MNFLRPLLATSAVAVLATLTSVLSALPAQSAAADPPAVTWAVRPADAAGPDGRAWAELSAAGGDTVVDYAAVQNLGSTDAEFTLSAGDGYFTDRGRFNMLPTGAESIDAGTWIDIPDTVVVPAGSVAVVPYTVTVPRNASPGDHAAGLAASIRQIGKAPDETAVGVESRVGFRVMVRVSGELKPSLTLADIETTVTPSWNPFAPSTADIRYTAVNDGNAQLSFGHQVPGGGLVPRGDLLPGESRRSKVSQTVWPLFMVPVELTVIPQVSDAMVGVAPLTRTIWVWAVPWSQLLLVGGVALLGGAALAGRARSKRRMWRLLRQAREEGRREGQASEAPASEGDPAVSDLV